MAMYPPQKVQPTPLNQQLPSQALAELMKVGAKPPVPSEHRLTELKDPKTSMTPLQGLKSFAMPNRPYKHLEG
jgi:hypothetical protein